MTNLGKAERNPLWRYLFSFTFVLTVLGSTSALGPPNFVLRS